MNESNSDNFVVFSQKLAGYLMWNGCRLLSIKPDKKEPTKFVYYFPNKDFVMKHIEAYKNNNPRKL